MNTDNNAVYGFKVSGKHRRNVYEMIFARLQQMGILDEDGEMKVAYMKFKSPGLMDLNVDRLWNDQIAIAHNGIQNGDVMADPDMEIQIFPKQKMAEALTYQNDYLGRYVKIYPEPGMYIPQLKKDLNRFLNDWLKRMIEVQKYELIPEETEVA
ncbi:MAG: DUF1249 domain-containing protein [Smithella sp.]